MTTTQKSQPLPIGLEVFFTSWNGDKSYGAIIKSGPVMTTIEHTSGRKQEVVTGQLRANLDGDFLGFKNGWRLA